MAGVRVGTSGWSYPEWVGPFYPKPTPPARMLEYYAGRLRTVEAHSTHRRTPTEASLSRWVSQVPPDFRFAPKAHAGITHRRDLDGMPERMEAFFASLRPLDDRLGPTLFVLPHRQPDLHRLELLLSSLPATGAGWPPPAVFELGPAWRTDEVLEMLAQHNASLALIDRDPGQEGPEPAAVPAGPMTYVRLRRSRYTDDELKAWAARLAAAAGTGDGDVYVFLKHDEHGDAPRYAQTLVEHLERA
ncbi:MAG: DUF72 domain-containing protein [Acidimicrobiales bacterium]